MADAYQWTPEQVLNLTLRQLKVYTTKADELKKRTYDTIGPAIAMAKKIEATKQKAVQNLIDGKPWNWRI